MANNVDERIVEAQFDASKFEKGVDKTIKKLDELKESLQLKDTSTSITELADKTEKATDKASKSLEKLSDRFTTFTGMIKQKLLGGLADQVAGVFFKMEHSISSFVNTLSSQQVSVGMGKYEQMLTSVRTMVSAGIGQGNAYKAIERLAEYSDQTSYSLEQMTDAMSKMVAAGVDLDTAAKSVEGIANACAVAGVNATDASRAYYNLSQAYSSGFLKYTDYRSLELLNMTTAEFKNQMLEAAVAAGTLTKKVDKLGNTVYTTSNKKDKKVTGGKKVNTNNLSDALRYNFMNKEAMNRLFGDKYYLDMIDPEEINNKMIELAEKQFLTDGHTQQDLDKLREEQGEKEYRKTMQQLGVKPFIETYGELAYKAYMAAKEARSLTDVFNTLKDVISTGWSTSFEYIFGKLDKATEFFTWLTESDLANAIYAIGEWRNEVLGAWAQSDASADAKGGREYMIDALKNIDSILGNLNEAITKFAPDAKTLGFTLSRLSKEFADNTAKFKTWLTTKDEATQTSPLERFTRVVGAISNVVNIAGHAISTAFKLVQPVLTSLFFMLDRLIRPISDLGVNMEDKNSPFTKLRESIDNLYIVLKPVTDTLSTVLGYVGEIGAFFVSMGIDTVASNIAFFADALGLLIEASGNESAQQKNGHGVIAGIASDIEKLKAACTGAVDAVKEFLGSLLADLRTLLGLNNEIEGESKNNQNGIFANVIHFFDTNQFLKDADAWLKQASTDVRAWIEALPENVGNFFEKIQSAITGLFYEEKQKTIHGVHKKWIGKTEFLQRLEAWFTTIKDGITDFIAKIPERLANLGKLLFDSIYGIFYEKKSGTLFGKKIEWAGETQLTTWLKSISKTIKDWIKKLPKFSLKDIFRKIFYDEKTTEDKGVKKTTIEKSGFSMMLDQIFGTVNADSIRKKMLEFADVFQKTANNIKTTVTNVWNRVVDAVKNGNFEGLLGGIISDIKNLLLSFFSGSTENEYNTKWLGDKVAEAINWIKTKAEEVWPQVLTFFTELPGKIMNVFTGEGDEGKDTTPIEGAIKGFAETIGGFIASIPGTLLTFVDNAVAEIEKLWARIYKAMTGRSQKDDTYELANIDSLPKEAIKRHMPKQESKWNEFVQELGEVISSAFEKLPGWIATGLNVALQGIDLLLANMTINLGEHATEGLSDAVEKGGKNENQAALIISLQKLGETLSHLITETIPGFLSEGFNKVKEKASGWWDSLRTIFDGWLSDTSEHSEIKSKIGEIGLKFMDWIEEIPDQIRDAFRKVSRAIQGKRDYGGGIFNNIMDKIDESFEPLKKAQGVGKDSFGIEGIFITIGERIQAAFGLILPFVINGWNNTLESIRTILGYAISILNGDSTVHDALVEVFGEDNAKSIEDALTKFGDSIKDFIIKTVPEFIGSAFQTIITKGPALVQEFIDNLSKMFTSTAEAETEKANESSGAAIPKPDEKTIQTIGDRILGIIDFATDPSFLNKLPAMAGVIIAGAIIIRLIELLKEIAEGIDVAGSMADRARAKSSAGAVFKTLLVAIIAAMGLVAYMANLPKEQFDQANGLIDKLTGFFLALAGMYTGIEGMHFVTDIGDDIVAFKALKSGVKEFAKETSALKKTANGVARVGGFAVGAEVVSFTLNDIIQQFSSTFGIMGAGMATFADNAGDAFSKILEQASQMPTVTQYFDDILGIMDRTRKIVGYKNDVDTLSSMAGKLSLSLGFMTFSVSRGAGAKDAAEGIAEFTGLTDEMTTFVEFTEREDGVFDKFKYAMATLGSALSFSAKGNEYDEHSIEIAKKFLAALISDDGLMSLASELTPDKFGTEIDDMWTTSERILLFAGALAALGDAVSGFTEEKGQAIEDFYSALMHMTIADGTSKEESEKLSEKMNAIGAGLQSFAGSITGINQQDVEKAEYALTMLTSIGKRASAFGVNIFHKLFTGSTSLSDLGLQIRTLGGNIKDFYDNISPLDEAGNRAEVGFDTINKVLITVQSLAAANAMLGKSYTFHLSDMMGDLSGAATQVVAFLTELSYATHNIEGIGDVTIQDVDFVAVDSVVKSLLQLAHTASMLKGLEVSKTLRDFGNALTADDQGKTFAQRIADFYMNLHGQFSSDGSDIYSHIEDINAAISGVTSFANNLADMYIVNSSGIDQIIDGEKTVDQIITAVQTLLDKRTTIDELFNAFGGYSHYDLGTVNSVFSVLRLIGQTFSDFGNVNEATGINSVLQGISSMSSINPQVAKEALDPLLDSLVEYINEGENFEYISSIGTTIALTIAQGIQAAFDDPTNNEVKIRVTPILQMGDIQKQLQESGLTGVASGEFGGFKVDIPQQLYDAIKIPDYSEKLNTIDSSIGSLKESISSLSGDIRNIKIYLDGAGLVGGIIDDIDEQLNERNFYRARGLK